MSNMNITKTGQFVTDRNDIKYLVNNFTVSGNVTGWTFGGTNPTLANGVVTLTQSNNYGPEIYSSYFNVGANDIIAVEFTVALPSPSTGTGATGLYLGTPTGQGVYVHTFNHTTHVWNQSTYANNNPYFFNAYNRTDALTMKNYIIGASVSLNDVPWGETTNTSYPARAIQLPLSVTTSRLRSGYNANTGMVITFANPRFYNITQDGFYDSDDLIKASFGKNWVNAFSLIEY